MKTWVLIGAAAVGLYIYSKALRVKASNYSIRAQGCPPGVTC